MFEHNNVFSADDVGIQTHGNASEADGLCDSSTGFTVVFRDPYMHKGVYFHHVLVCS